MKKNNGNALVRELITVSSYSPNTNVYKKSIRSMIGKGQGNGLGNQPKKSQFQDDTTRDNYTQCTVKNMCAETEYKYYQSSRTFYEDMMVRTGLEYATVEGNNAKEIKVKRTIDYGKFFCTDTTFSLFKNLFYLRPGTFLIDDSSNKEIKKTHTETNLYYEVPKIIYYVLGEPYSQETFESQYTDLEYFLLIDLITSLVLDLISKREIEVLFQLFRKDRVLSRFLSGVEEQYDNFRKSKKAVYKVSINLFNICDYSLLTEENASVAAITREVITMLLHRIMSGIMPLLKRQSENIKKLSLKSINDFRMIIGVVEEELGDKNIFEMLLPEKENCDNVIIPKVFRKDEFKQHLQYLWRQQKQS